MEPATTTSSASTSKTSRVGKRPIELPKGVTANVAAGAIDVKGPKGQLKRDLVNTVSIKLDAGIVRQSSRRASPAAPRIVVASTRLSSR